MREVRVPPLWGAAPRVIPRALESSRSCGSTCSCSTATSVASEPKREPEKAAPRRSGFHTLDVSEEEEGAVLAAMTANSSALKAEGRRSLIRRPVLGQKASTSLEATLQELKRENEQLSRSLQERTAQQKELERNVRMQGIIFQTRQELVAMRQAAVTAQAQASLESSPALSEILSGSSQASRKSSREPSASTTAIDTKGFAEACSSRSCVSQPNLLHGVEAAEEGDDNISWITPCLADEERSRPNSAGSELSFRLSSEADFRQTLRESSSTFSAGAGSEALEPIQETARMQTWAAGTIEDARAVTPEADPAEPEEAEENEEEEAKEAALQLAEADAAEADEAEEASAAASQLAADAREDAEETDEAATCAASQLAGAAAAEADEAEEASAAASQLAEADAREAEETEEAEEAAASAASQLAEADAAEVDEAEEASAAALQLAEADAREAEETEEAEEAAASAASQLAEADAAEVDEAEEADAREAEETEEVEEAAACAASQLAEADAAEVDEAEEADGSESSGSSSETSESESDSEDSESEASEASDSKVGISCASPATDAGEDEGDVSCRQEEEDQEEGFASPASASQATEESSFERSELSATALWRNRILGRAAALPQLEKVAIHSPARTRQPQPSVPQYAARPSPAFKPKASSRMLELSGTDALVSLRFSAKELAREKLKMLQQHREAQMQSIEACSSLPHLREDGARAGQLGLKQARNDKVKLKAMAKSQSLPSISRGCSLTAHAQRQAAQANLHGLPRAVDMR
ncbi:unnamed protein product [Effrenium voratum]|uniref:Uncharacterized protein n=1 Tax=Effrenium voratum TaxID=2562239 RepID=A0AA36IV97_9DINO|nr:unnamed protein product [Effrenium voratum]